MQTRLNTTPLLLWLLLQKQEQREVAPIADISNIAENQIVRDGLFDLIGVADDADPADIVSWEVTVQSVAQASLPVVLLTGSNRVSGGDSFGILDFTMLENGVYQLDLTVRGGNDFDSDTVTFC